VIFEQLECFLVVAKLGTVSRAAEAMFLTQPSLTERLKALENEVGDQLFVRTKWGMRLTEAGREFLPYAERCVTSLENGKQRLRKLQEGIGGQLKLGALPRVSTYALPEFLEEFASAHPDVLLLVQTGHSQDILEMVLTEEVHLGLARPMSHPEVENLPLYDEELVLVVNPQHRFAQQDCVSLGDVAREQLILFDRASSNYELTKALFRNSGVREPRTIELDNLEAAKRMVEHHLGVSFIPRQAVLRAVAAGRLCVIGVNDSPELRRSISAMRRVDVPLTGAAAAFLELANRMIQTPGARA
jgi:DNA-binding transcriptional LysR family regulator